MNHYNKVLEFNTLFEAKSIKLGWNPSEDEIKLVNFRISLIVEESQELQDAVKDKDIVEVIDALIDIIYVAHGMLSSIGHNPHIEKIDTICNNTVRENLSSLLSEELTVFINNVYDNNYDKDKLSNTQSILLSILHMLSNITSYAIFDDDAHKAFISHYTESIFEQVAKLKNFQVEQVIGILKCAYTCLTAFGIDINKAFDIVHSSNMSKLCPTEDIAIKTVDWYKNSDKYKSVYDSPNYRKSKGGDFYIVYNESTGKILKNINYTAANLKKLF